MYDLDSHKLHLWPGQVDNFAKGRTGITPITVELGATSACNQRCTFCAFDYRKPHTRLSPDAIANFIGDYQMKCVPRSVVFAGDGEPTLYPDFDLLVKRCRDMLIQIGVMTNGTWWRTKTLLKDLTWIRFSINAIDPAKYTEIHGTDERDLENVLENIERCIQEKHEERLPVTIGVQCLLLEADYDGYELLAGRCAEIGVDYLVFKPYSKHPQSENDQSPDYSLWDWKQLKKRLSLYQGPMQIKVRENALNLTANAKPYTNCLAAPFFAVVASDGRVYPCAQWIDDVKWCMGDLNVQTWDEIVDGSRREKIIKRLQIHDCSTCRRPCRLDSANEYLHRILHRGPHDSFL